MSALKRSEEEEALLRDIREEKERLWVDIQVSFTFSCCDFNKRYLLFANCRNCGGRSLTLIMNWLPWMKPMTSEFERP